MIFHLLVVQLKSLDQI